MLYRLAADVMLLLHLAFIIFVLLGGLLTARKRGLLLLHLPALGWGVLVELTSRGCPLTDWENRLRRLAGDAGYSESFVEHYLIPVIYPSWLSLQVQYVLAAVVVITNLLIYGWVWWSWRHAAKARR